MTVVCSQILHCDRKLSTSTINRRCAAVFGLKPKNCVHLWYHLKGMLPNGAAPEHMLWALSFLKLYEVGEARAWRLGVDEKIAENGTKILIFAICKLPMVCKFGVILLCSDLFHSLDFWSNRLKEEPFDQRWNSVDGTDCPINEPRPISAAWYSHKIKAAGLRYEIVVSIRKAHILSVTGPWACGSHSDLKIFRNGTRKFLVLNEFVIADNGYADNRCIQPPVEHHFQHSV